MQLSKISLAVAWAAACGFASPTPATSEPVTSVSTRDPGHVLPSILLGRMFRGTRHRTKARPDAEAQMPVSESVEYLQSLMGHGRFTGRKRTLKPGVMYLWLARLHGNKRNMKKLTGQHAFPEAAMDLKHGVPHVYVIGLRIVEGKGGEGGDGGAGHHRGDWDEGHHRGDDGDEHHRGDDGDEHHRGDDGDEHHRGDDGDEHHRGDDGNEHHRGDDGDEHHRGDDGDEHHRDDDGDEHHKDDGDEGHHRGDDGDEHHKGDDGDEHHRDDDGDEHHKDDGDEGHHRGDGGHDGDGGDEHRKHKRHEEEMKVDALSWDIKTAVTSGKNMVRNAQPWPMETDPRLRGESFEYLYVGQSRLRNGATALEGFKANLASRGAKWIPAHQMWKRGKSTSAEYAKVLVRGYSKK